MITLVIKVKPGAGRDEISFDAEGTLQVKIRAKPVDGKANDYLVKYLADELGLSRSKVQLEKGAVSRTKRISINVTEAEWSEMKKKLNKK